MKKLSLLLAFLACQAVSANPVSCETIAKDMVNEWVPTSNFSVGFDDGDFITVTDGFSLKIVSYGCSYKTRLVTDDLLIEVIEHAVEDEYSRNPKLERYFPKVEVSTARWEEMKKSMEQVPVVE